MGKILIYAMQEGLGGIEQYVMNLSRYCVSPQEKYGYIVLGKTTIYEDILKRNNVDYFFVTHKNESIYSNIKELEKLFIEKRDEYDTIYFNTSGLYYPIPYILAKKYKYKIVLHSHLTSGTWPKRLVHYFNRKWINRITQVRLACSTPAGRWMFGEQEFKVVPNAIDIGRFVFNKKNRIECREKYNLNNRIVIGHIGRLSKIKNQSFLVDIFEKYHEINENSTLMLVGDGEDRERLEEKVTEKQILDCVVFIGRTDYPEYYMSAMDCLVMPSITEGFPITLIEAQDNGLPCVVSDTITKEVNITNRIRFVSLKDKIDRWIYNIEDNLERYDCSDLLKEKGYDVRYLEKMVYKLIKP